MGMPLLERGWTAEEVREHLLSDRRWPRYELIDGELIVTSPSFAHEKLCMWLYHCLYDYLRAEPVGKAHVSLPADLALIPGTISQPDVFVPPIAEERSAREWCDFKHLLLAIEVLSPSTARYDRGLKRIHYQAAGVEEYWIVDPSPRLIERWRPEDERPEIIRERMIWRPAGAGSALEFGLSDLFAAPD
jgi:Uma2 family endonuclease